MCSPEEVKENYCLRQTLKNVIQNTVVMLMTYMQASGDEANLMHGTIEGIIDMIMGQTFV